MSRRREAELGSRAENDLIELERYDLADLWTLLKGPATLCFVSYADGSAQGKRLFELRNQSVEEIREPPRGVRPIEIEILEPSASGRAASARINKFIVEFVLLTREQCRRLNRPDPIQSPIPILADALIVRVHLFSEAIVARRTALEESGSRRR